MGRLVAIIMHNTPSGSLASSEEETAVYRPSLPFKSTRAIINCGLLPVHSSDLTAIKSPARSTRKPREPAPLEDSQGSDDSLLSELVDLMSAKPGPVKKGRRVVLKARSAAHSPDAAHASPAAARSPREERVRKAAGKAGFVLLSPRQR